MSTEPENCGPRPDIPDELHGEWHPVHGFNGEVDTLDIVSHRSGVEAKAACSPGWRPVLIGVNPSWRERAEKAEKMLDDIASVVDRLTGEDVYLGGHERARAITEINRLLNAKGNKSANATN